MYYEGLASEGDRLRKYISISSTSSIFIEDHLGSISRGERDRDSEWVDRLGEIGEVRDLGYTSGDEKDIGVSSSIPKGLGANDSISGVSLLGGFFSLEWENGHLGKCPSSKMA